jgi:hypothetical protein
MPGIIDPANTGENLAAQDAELVKKLWQKGAELKMAEEDIFSGLEGSGPEAVIETETATSTGKGQKAIYPIISEFSDEPHLGGDRFDTQDDFEQMLLGHDEVAVDFHRFAYSDDERGEEVLGMRGELHSRVNELQGRQMGKYWCHHLLMTMLHRVNAENVLNPRSVTGYDAILADDTLGYDQIVRMAAFMDPMGGMPFKVGKDSNGNAIRRRLVIPTSAACLGLDNDPVFKANLKDAGDRGGENHLFFGGYPKVKGNIIREWNPIDQDSEGAIGSPLNPKAWLGVAITAGTTTFDLKGGGNATSAAKTKKKFFKYFPLFAYPFQKNVTLSWSSPIAWQLTGGNFFVVVVNPPSAATDPDKWGMYEISANDGNKLTVAKRLAAATSGIANTTVGSVTWDNAVNTDVHPEKALVYLANAKGTPLGITPMLGARAMRRALGKYRLKRSDDTAEGQFIREKYIASVFGHAVRKDRSGRVPGIVLMRHAISYEGWNHPQPTS